MKTIDSNYKIKHQHDDIVAIEIDSISDDLAIAAYGDGVVPSLILQNLETKETVNVSFFEFEGFSIWSADLNFDSLKICLVR